MDDSKKTKSSYSLFNELDFSKIYDKISRPIIIADNLRTPENIGATLRLAANIGAEKVLFVNDEGKQFNSSRIIRTASGAMDKLFWKIILSEELQEQIPDNYQLIAMETLPEASNIFEFTFPENVAFVVGNEVNGISDELLSKCGASVLIPIPGIISSLNVSHALAVALFEWLRQMNLKL